MSPDTYAVRGAARLNSKLSVKDLGEWELGIKEACAHLGLAMPKEPTASAGLELTLERMLLELRDDLGDEKAALSILFGTNDFLSQMAKKFPRGGEVRLVASAMPDGSVMAWLRSDKAKLGRMAARALESASEGLGRRLMSRLAAVNASRQGGLQLEEMAHLERAQDLWSDLPGFDQLPSAAVVGLDKGHPVAKWLKGTSERFSAARRASDEEEGAWKEGVISLFEHAPLAFANLGSSFEVWSDFKPESLLGRLQELTNDAPTTIQRAPMRARQMATPKRS